MYFWTRWQAARGAPGLTNLYMAAMDALNPIIPQALFFLQGESSPHTCPHHLQSPFEIAVYYALKACRNEHSPARLKSSRDSTCQLADSVSLTPIAVPMSGVEGHLAGTSSSLDHTRLELVVEDSYSPKDHLVATLLTEQKFVKLLSSVGISDESKAQSLASAQGPGRLH